MQCKKFTPEEVVDIAGLMAKYACGLMSLGALDKELRERLCGYSPYLKILRSAILFCDGIVEDTGYRTALGSKEG